MPVGVVACLFKKLVQNYTENLSPRLYRNIFSYIIQFGWLDTMFTILFFLNVIICVKILQFLSNKCLSFSPKQILGDFLYVDKEGIVFEMSYFPALYQFCLGSTLILPD